MPRPRLISVRTIARLVLLTMIVGSAAALLPAQDLTVKAYLDRSSVRLGERFTLSIEIAGSSSRSAADPELPEMEGFATFLGSGSSQQIQLINGRVSSSKTITFTFQATQIGDFEIGAIKVKRGGQVHQTSPLKIQVTPVSQPQAPSSGQSHQDGFLPEGDLFVRAEVNKERAYQNEAIVLSYKIYTRVNVSSFSISKQPGTAGFWVEEEPQQKQPTTSAEVIGGKRYTVATIRKMILFPTSSGPKTISPLVLECEVKLRRRSRDPFRGFFSDSLFGEVRRKLVASQELKIDVLPLPEKGKPVNFKGAVGTFSVKSWIDKSDVKAHDAVTLKVQVSGAGNFSTLGEPEVPIPATFETYPPKLSQKLKRTARGLSGEKVYEYVLIPRSVGSQRIGPVGFSYFDPSSAEYSLARADEIVIDVAPGEEALSANPGMSKQELKLIGQDIRFIKSDPASFRKVGASIFGRYTFWLPLLFPMVCLLGALGYRRHLDRLSGDVAYARDRRAVRLARKRLGSARSYIGETTQREFFGEVGKALMGFLGDKLNIAEAGMVSDEVGRLLLQREVPETTVERYFECMKVCDLKRFAPSEAGIAEMKGLLDQAEAAMVEVDRHL